VKLGDRVKLLFGPYRAQPLSRGDRTFCLLRDCPVVISGWTAAPIPWPRCHCDSRPGEGLGSRWGLLVDEELLRAIRHESVTAVAYWWGVSTATVVRWRRVFGVKPRENEGTYRLRCSAIQATMDARPAGGRLWTAEELALVGALPDAEVGRCTGRTRDAVAKKRNELRRQPVHGKRARPALRQKGQ
jgi:hypothetical protein